MSRSTLVGFTVLSYISHIGTNLQAVEQKCISLHSCKPRRPKEVYCAPSPKTAKPKIQSSVIILVILASLGNLHLLLSEYPLAAVPTGSLFPTFRIIKIRMVGFVTARNAVLLLRLQAVDTDTRVFEACPPWYAAMRADKVCWCQCGDGGLGVFVRVGL